MDSDYQNPSVIATALTLLNGLGLNTNNLTVLSVAGLGALITTDGSGRIAINALRGNVNNPAPTLTISGPIAYAGIQHFDSTPFYLPSNASGGQTDGISVVAGLKAWAVTRGADDRQDVAATDGAAVTIYAVPAGGGRFRIGATLMGSSGTVTSAIYTIKYTLDGVVTTRTISISAVDTDASYFAIINPDASTNITGQLTTLTGAGATVDIAAYVEGMSNGT